MNSIPLSALPSPIDETRRDQWGRYLVVPPQGGQPVGYTRATTVAKVLDDGGGLAPWKASMTAVGMMTRPGLRAEWEALIATYDANPWYGSDAGKKACKDLVERCSAVGGANDRKEQGLSLHTITALVDAGRMPQHLSPETEADVTAYVNGLAAAGVVMVPGAIEITVVLDEFQVAGTFDRLVRVPGFDDPLIADLKTGADLSYSWNPFAVQLAIYSRADDIYRQGLNPNGSDDVRIEMPKVEQSHGLIIWLDAGSASCRLFLVDLDAGWEAFDHSLWARQWRRTEVSVPFEQYRAAPAGDLVDLLQASLDAVEAKKAAPVLPSPGLDEQAGHVGPGNQGLRGWLQDRIDVIGQHGDLARHDLSRVWPADLPTLRTTHVHTPEQLAEIEKLIDGVETRHSIPFGPNRPETSTLDDLFSMFPGSKLVES